VTSTERYRERLLPHWWVGIAAMCMVLMLAVAYGAALGRTAGVTMAVAGSLLVGWLLWITSPVIIVTSDALTVAGARLPLAAVAGAREVDGAEINALRGPGSDARLFVALRPWSAVGGVMVELSDPDDPHPGWLFTSRHPARVLEAMAGTI
jgi:hypothetical protein